MKTNTPHRAPHTSTVHDETFQQIHDRFARRVQHVCWRILRNEHEAEDAAQDTFLAIWSKLHTLRRDHSTGAWVGRLAMNVGIDGKRRRRARPCRLLADLVSAPRAEATPLEWPDDTLVPQLERLAQRDRDSQVRRAVARLSPKLRAVVRLRYFEHLSYDEIATRLTLSMGTVKSRLSRAHEALGTLLSPPCSERSA